MAVLDWFRSLLSGPPHLNDTTDDAGEVTATLSEEYDTALPGAAYVKKLEQASHLLPTSEAAGAAAEDLESMEAPPDLDP